MVDLVIQTAAQLGAAVVAITHDAEEALLFGDTLLLLDGSGKVEQSTVDLPSGRTSQYRFTDEFQKHRAGILAKARG
jgi:ABC-type nitrate/sulfonate/bicarbonate transport system ATPase subunit